MPFLKNRIGCCFLFCLLLIPCAKGLGQAPAAPQYPLMLPSNGAWVIYRNDQYSNGFISAWRMVFIEQGSNWRLEIEKHRGPVTVAVYDGHKLFISRKSKLRPEQLNPLVSYQQVYKDIQRQFVYNDIEEVNGYACWRFIGSGSQGTNSMIWVEMKGQMIRKAFTRSAEGEMLTEEFFNLPAEITLGNNLFDSENLSPVLITQLKSWKIK